MLKRLAVVAFVVMGLLGTLCLMVVAMPTAVQATPAAQAATCEDFESGYTLGAELRTHADWFYESGNTGPIPTAGIGVNGSIGLSNGDRIFTWVAHPFDWNDSTFQSITLQMDYQTDGSGHFDDDRMGWMISDTDDDSSNIFGVQMDPGGGGYKIEGYWDGTSSSDERRPSIVDLPALSNNAWYRLEAEFTKLTATSASISVTLSALDGSGNPTGVVVSGSIADTSALGADAPNSQYFTADTMWPAYKNYDGIGGAADNACFEIDSGPPPPRTLTVSVVGSGTVTLDPPGGTYVHDTGVELTADPDTGWAFSRWSGDLSGSANPETISMTSDMNVTATFLPGSGEWCEDFESGYTLNADVGNHPDWFDGADDSGSNVESGIGVASSIGLAEGQWMFTWVAHPFDWNVSSLKGVGFQMDFQTDSSGHFDDDRMGWMIVDDDNDSDNIFGVQLDHSDGGIVTYWRDSGDVRVQDQIVDLTGTKANTWYRFQAEITKLTATSAKIDVSLVELDGSGNPTGTPFTGTVADTGALGGDAPDTKYFTADTMWPAYKNYQALDGAADNACFEIIGMGSIVIVKQAQPEGNQSFDFAGDLGAFSLIDDGTLSNTATFTDVTVGTYAITETIPANWVLDSIVCQDADAGSTINVDTASAMIDLDAGEVITCTFTNREEYKLYAPMVLKQYEP